MSIPDYRFFWGALSFLNKSLMLMLRMLCDPSLLNWLTLVLTVSHINLSKSKQYSDCSHALKVGVEELMKWKAGGSSSR